MGVYSGTEGEILGGSQIVVEKEGILMAVMCMCSVFCYQRCAYGHIILAG